MSQEVWADSMRSQVESAFYYTLFNSVTAKFAGQCGMVKVNQLYPDLKIYFFNPNSISPQPSQILDFVFSQNMIFITVINSFLVESTPCAVSDKTPLVRKSPIVLLVAKHFGKLDVTYTQDLISYRPLPADSLL